MEERTADERPMAEGGLGPVTTRESRGTMAGGELRKGGKTGWEE